MAHAKTLAVSQNLLLPWEVLRFGQGALPGISETGKPPDTLLHEARNARNVAPALFDGNAAHPSFTSMRSKVTSMRDVLRSVDRSLAQLTNFLQHVADGIVEKQIRDQIGAPLPPPRVNICCSETMLQDAIRGIKDITCSPSVVCPDPALQKEVDATSFFLGQLADSACPASGPTPKFFGCVEKTGV